MSLELLMLPQENFAPTNNSFFAISLFQRDVGTRHRRHSHLHSTASDRLLPVSRVSR
jgi:hypothetical protein